MDDEKQKGKPGRKPNPNRIAIEDALRTLKYDPLAELVRVASDPATDLAIKVGIDRDLLNYIHAKKKHVQHDLGKDSGLEEVMKLVATKGRAKPPSVFNKPRKKKDEPESEGS